MRGGKVQGINGIRQLQRLSNKLCPSFEFKLHLRKILRPRRSRTLICIRVKSWQCFCGISDPARAQCAWRAARHGPRHLRPHQVAVPRRGGAHVECRYERGPDDRCGGALHGNRWKLGEYHRPGEWSRSQQPASVEVRHKHEFAVRHLQWWIRYSPHNVIWRNCAKYVAVSCGNVSCIDEGILVYGKQCCWLCCDCFSSCKRQNGVRNLDGQKPVGNS